MFEIEYKGANCIVITTKKSKLIVDPKLSIVGLKDIATKDAVELATEDRFVVNDTDATLVINSPGEYGIAGFDIKGVAARRHLDSESENKMSTMYRVEFSDVRMAILGNVYEKLSEEQLEELGVVDILVIPIGGAGYTLDATGAIGLIRKIDPKIVIPVHYSDHALKYEVPQGDLQTFITELGAPTEKVAKYKFKQLPVMTVPLTVIEIERS